MRSIPDAQQAGRNFLNRRLPGQNLDDYEGLEGTKRLGGSPVAEGAEMRKITSSYHLPLDHFLSTRLRPGPKNKETLVISIVGIASPRLYHC